MDERLRTLERQAEHDPEAAARLLLERVRRGLLDEARLELAADLGHEAARRALALEPGAAARPRDLEPWLMALAPWGGAVVVRGMVAAAASVVPRFEALAPDDRRPREALAAAVAWCDAPGVEPARVARAAARRAQGAAQAVGRRADFRAEWSIDTPELYAAFHAAHLCAHVADAVVLGRAPPQALVDHVADAFVRALERTGVAGDQVLADATKALLAWALDAA